MAPKQRELLSDQEVIERIKADPAKRAKLDEALERIRSQGAEGPRIDAEGLSDFLRVHG